MAFKGLFAAGAIALTLAFSTAVVPTPAEAKTKIVIGIGTGHGYGYGGCWSGRRYVCGGWRAPLPGYYAPRHRPVYYYDRYPRVVSGKVGCNVAKDILRGNGYNKIVARDCSGTSYSFKARKNGRSYIVRMNAVNGRITGTSRL